MGNDDGFDWHINCSINFNKNFMSKNWHAEYFDGYSCTFRSCLWFCTGDYGHKNEGWTDMICELSLYDDCDVFKFIMM